MADREVPGRRVAASATPVSLGVRSRERRPRCLEAAGLPE